MASLPRKGSGPSVTKVNRGWALGGGGGHAEVQGARGEAARGGQAGLKAER